MVKKNRTKAEIAAEIAAIEVRLEKWTSKELIDAIPTFSHRALIGKELLKKTKEVKLSSIYDYLEKEIIENFLRHYPKELRKASLHEMHQAIIHDVFNKDKR